MRRSWLRDSFFRISKKDEEKDERKKAFVEIKNFKNFLLISFFFFKIG